jgi:hypothetical protein
VDPFGDFSMSRQPVDRSSKDGSGLIDAYAFKAFGESANSRGPFPAFFGPEDMAQEVHLQLFEEFGPHYGDRIAEAKAHDNWSTSPEHCALKRAVSAAIGHGRWTEDKRRQRKLPRRTGSNTALGGIVAPLVTEAVDFAIDLQRVMAGFSHAERRIWDLARAGWTLREIGVAVALDPRRVCEIRQRLVETVAALFQEPT